MAAHSRSRRCSSCRSSSTACWPPIRCWAPPLMQPRWERAMLSVSASAHVVRRAECGRAICPATACAPPSAGLWDSPDLLRSLLPPVSPACAARCWPPPPAAPGARKIRGQPLPPCGSQTQSGGIYHDPAHGWYEEGEKRMQRRRVPSEAAAAPAQPPGYCCRCHCAHCPPDVCAARPLTPPC